MVFKVIDHIKISSNDQNIDKPLWSQLLHNVQNFSYDRTGRYLAVIRLNNVEIWSIEPSLLHLTSLDIPQIGDYLNIYLTWSFDSTRLAALFVNNNSSVLIVWDLNTDSICTVIK